MTVAHDETWKKSESATQVLAKAAQRNETADVFMSCVMPDYATFSNVPN
jgi:hypothetical protein